MHGPAPVATNTKLHCRVGSGLLPLQAIFRRCSISACRSTGDASAASAKPVQQRAMRRII
jgi:hypothetical protein